MLALALNQSGPCAIRYPRAEAYRPAGAYICPLCNQNVEDVKHPHEGMRSDRAEILREGSDFALVGLGSMAWPAYEAAAALSKEGFDPYVVNARFVTPIDSQLFKELSQKIKLFITVEEGVLDGGFGSALLESFEKENIDCKVRRIGLPRKFIEHAKREELLKMCGLTPAGIAVKVREFVKIKDIADVKP